MAITKIWTVKSRLDSSLNYIANPDKTSIKPDIDAVEGVIKYIKNEDKIENCLYVKAYNCTTDNPYADMEVVEGDNVVITTSSGFNFATRPSCYWNMTNADGYFVI